MVSYIRAIYCKSDSTRIDSTLPAARHESFAFSSCRTPDQIFVKAVYTTDPFEVTWTFVTGFFGQEKVRGIKVDSWISEYNRLQSDQESR